MWLWPFLNISIIGPILLDGKGRAIVPRYFSGSLSAGLVPGSGGTLQCLGSSPSPKQLPHSPSPEHPPATLPAAALRGVNRQARLDCPGQFLPNCVVFRRLFGGREVSCRRGAVGSSESDEMGSRGMVGRAFRERSMSRQVLATMRITHALRLSPRNWWKAR